MASTITAAPAATVTVMPGANCVKVPDPAVIPAIVSAKVTRPAAAAGQGAGDGAFDDERPAHHPARRPHELHDRDLVSPGVDRARTLLMVTVTATNPSSARNAKPATATPNTTAWMRW